jgi:hypothetical protein
VCAAGIVVLLAAPVGCGDDDDSNDRENRPEPVAGTFVGELQGSGDEFVAVVAAPPAKGEDRRDVSAFVCDAKQFCSSFSGSAEGNVFVAKSADGDAQTRVRLSGKAATGSVDLPDDEKGRYRAGSATATAGLYDLTVSANGRIRGASAAGVGLKGRSTLPQEGSGSIRLADGRRLRFDITRSSGDDPIRLSPGEMRLIVLQDGRLKGAAKSRSAEGGDASDFFVASAPK